MIARGVTPRFAIGTSNAVIFFVALATSLTLAVGLVVFVLGATVHDAHLKRPGRALLPRGTGGVWSAVHLP